MGTKLSKAPVCLTLAQVRFNVIPLLDKSLPEIQDRLRQVGFPVYSSSLTHLIELVSTGEGQMQQRQSTGTRHVFSNVRGTDVLTLDQNSLTYELSDYPVFETFLGQFRRALEVLSNLLPLEVTERLGMRMVDVVQPLRGEELERYLKPEVFGLSRVVKTPLEHQQSLTESVYRSGTRGLVFRAVRVPSGMALPPDLSANRAKIDQRFLDYKGETVMLDCDSFDDGHRAFAIGEVVEALNLLKADLSACFKAAITQYAEEIWR